jgi:DNA ligase-1
MRLGRLVATSQSVAATSGRLEKIERLASLLADLSPDEIEVAVAFLSGSARQGRIGIGFAAISTARETSPAEESTLELADVDASFTAIAGLAGSGSSGERSRLLGQLLGRATRDEQAFLVRVLTGELRQGALEGVLLEAVARAARLPSARIRRAAMLAGMLAPVARAALVEGDAGLSRFLLQPFQPIQPMLADSADEVSDALAVLGRASFEYKLDGARIQLHKVGDDVRVYSRNLRDVTDAVPEIVEIARAFPVREAILDGEVIALRADGSPWPFQITMRRFGRKLDVERLRRELPMTPVFFDALHVDGEPLVDEPQERRALLVAEIVPPMFAVPRLVTADPGEASSFFERALATGHEGVMAKATEGLYAAGRRGQAWLKVKRARTLDLVVLAAEWGHGRRQGTLSNLHLGARDPEHGGFVMLGKTFKGLTDQMLAWQTRALLDLEIGRDAYTVHVRPELVVEIAFNEIQASPHYPGGVALRFARVKRYRSDKPAVQADTIQTVLDLYKLSVREP